MRAVARAVARGVARGVSRAETVVGRVVTASFAPRARAVTSATRAMDATRDARRAGSGWSGAPALGSTLARGVTGVGTMRTTRTYAKKVAVGKGGKTRTKIKPYSSYAYRFKLSGSGTKILRKQKGKRHCAFSKTPKRRRMLRKTATVHATLVGPMKKLGFN